MDYHNPPPPQPHTIMDYKNNNPHKTPKNKKALQSHFKKSQNYIIQHAMPIFHTEKWYNIVLKKS